MRVSLEAWRDDRVSVRLFRAKIFVATGFTMDRSLVFISGYYGFDNLGDEAILEELCTELKRLVRPEEIVVLSANPELTAKQSVPRSLRKPPQLPPTQK